MRLLPLRVSAAVNKLLALRARKGPYRFLVSRWDRFKDIELAIRVLGSEYFRGELKPVPLPVDSRRSILVVAPHQDDEVIGAGGTLILAGDARVKVAVLYITDGGQVSRRWPVGPKEATRIRNMEACEVCSKLGATKYDLGIWNPEPRPTTDDVDRLSKIIDEVGPDVVMVPWILDIPAKHRIPNHLLWLAEKRNGLPNFEIWGYQVHNTLYPNGYVDITEVAERKRELLQCFSSQNEHFQRYDHLAMGMAAWNSRFLREEPRARYAEVFFTLPKDEHLHLVESFYFQDMESTYLGDARVIPGMAAVHTAVVRDGRARHVVRNKEGAGVYSPTRVEGSYRN